MGYAQNRQAVTVADVLPAKALIRLQFDRRRSDDFHAETRRMTSVLGRFYAAVIVSGLFVSTVTDACSADSELGHFVNERYGKRIEFDVLRDGKPIGEHVTTFARTANGLEVHSRTELSISVLFIPVYRFEYDSQSLWCGEILSRLSARTKDRGENTLTEVETAAGGLVVR